MVPLKNCWCDSCPFPCSSCEKLPACVKWPSRQCAGESPFYTLWWKAMEKVIRVGFNVIRQASVRLSLQLQIGAYYAFSLIDLLILQTLYPWRETHDSTQDCSTPFICRQITILKAGTCAFCCLALPAYLIFEWEGSQQRWKGRLWVKY